MGVERFVLGCYAYCRTLLQSGSALSGGSEPCQRITVVRLWHLTRLIHNRELWQTSSTALLITGTSRSTYAVFVLSLCSGLTSVSTVMVATGVAVAVR